MNYFVEVISRKASTTEGAKTKEAQTAPASMAVKNINIGTYL